MSVQSSNGTSTNSSSSNSSSSGTQITTDFDIFGVGDSINTSNYVYDGQTVLLVNSSASQNSSTVRGVYFDPTKSASLGYNWSMTGNSNLSSNFASRSVLDTNYNLMQNFIPDGNIMPTSTIDLLNATSTSTTNAAGPVTINGSSYYNTNTSTVSMALLGTNTYTTSGGLFNNGAAPTDTTTDYPSNSASASYQFTGNYYYPQTSDIIVVDMVYTINGTDLLSSSASTTNPLYPTVTAVVTNRVITKEAMANGSTNGKMYTAGPINLSYISSGQDFSTSYGSYGNNYNVPVIIADNCTKIYATLSLVYVPYNTSNGNYLNQGSGNYDVTPVTDSGFFLGTANSASGTANCVNIGLENGIKTTTGSGTTSGHFVVCLSYSSGVATNYAGSYSYCDLLLKNIWRSPISVYNTYSSYSVSDMATKQVIVLFGKSKSGATFMITNSGTSISSVTNYAVTSLSNFIGLMNSAVTYYNNTSSLVSFFTDSTVVATNNYAGNTNNIALTIQPLLGGSIINPDSVTTSPNMWYMLLQTSNSANMSVDPTSQDLFNNDVGNYFDLQNSSLCATGKINYSNSVLSILTAGSSFLFGNSIYSGKITINNQNFYNLLILPEAQFNGAPTSNAGNLSIYSVSNSPFYASTSSTSNSSTRYDTSSGTSKQTMTVSNIDIV